MKEDSAAATLLRQLFGDNRAEWPPDHFSDLFVAPVYLTKLESMRPCLLVGGRGTGKTTSLQSLSYASVFERLVASGQTFEDQAYLGILVRMNKNRVRAFDGSNIDATRWSKYFAHYFNLLVCSELAAMAVWLEEKTERFLSPTAIGQVSGDLGLGVISDIKQLQNAIKAGISQLQLEVNNPGTQSSISLSMAEVPLRTFASVLREEGLLGDRVIFCCVDEYENLLDYQQAIINTYVKHAEPPLSYKVGVRKFGLRNRQTLDAQDLLKTPDDYLEIEIADEGFEYFARAVAELRLRRAKEKGINVPETLQAFLAELSFAEEAALLGAEKVADDVLIKLKGTDLFTYFSAMPKSESYFLAFWHESENKPLLELADNWKQNESAWRTRLGNYGYASLFWLSKGNKGVRIRKYYCGERVLLALAAGNIRYFLELIDSAIDIELNGRDQVDTTLTISAKSQTLAAREVGKRRLNQLEGLADHGVQLKRLVLAIGKVFFELAREPNGKSPEVTSFVLSGSPACVEAVSVLLEEGIAHLAFESDAKTKLTSKAEIRDNEYRLHRIFSAFFEISHRKKRRMNFDAKDLLAVLDDSPSKAISAMLDGKQQSTEGDLPAQMALFSAFYEGGDTH